MNAREQDVAFGGHIIGEKALEFVKELNVTDFKSSEEWLDWWKNRQCISNWTNRHNVVFRTVSGEERPCTAETTLSWEQIQLPMIVSKYEVRDIYNSDDFGLFYQQLPTKKTFI